MAGLIDTLSAAQQVELLYVAYYNRAAEGNGYLFWQQAYTAELASGKSASAALASLGNYFSTAAETTALYPFLSNTSTLSASDPVAVASVQSLISDVYTNLFGRTPDDAGKAFWANAILTGSISLASAILEIANGATGDDASVLTNKTTVASYFTTQTAAASLGVNAATTTATLLNEAGTILTTVTKDAASVTAADSSIDTFISGGSAVPGQSFTLTTGADTFVGGTGNDTFSATERTFTPFDSLTGGAGNDTLTITDTSGTAILPAAFTGVTVSGIETLNVNAAQTAVNADVSAWTGLTTVNVVEADNTKNVTLTTKGNATTASIKGGAVVAITDSATTDKLASVTFDGFATSATVTSDVLTKLSVANTAANTTVTAAAGTRALGLTLNAVTGNVTDATATSLDVSTTGAASTTGLVAVAAKTVTIAADEALTLAAATNLGAATKITVTGDSLVTIAAGGTYTALTEIDASAQTAGGVNSSALAFGAGVAFAGGAGADSIQLGAATTKAITMGDGNDRVLLASGVTALGAGGSIDGGVGTTDVIAFADGDDIGTATATSTFAGTISGFEKAEIAGAAGAAVTVNLANLDNISTLAVTADVASALTVNNMASGGTMEYTVSQTSTGAINIINAVTGTADVLNVSIKGAAGVNTGALTVANVETINFLTDDTAATPTGIAHISNVTTGNVATTITVTGDAGLALTEADTSITTFNASGVTKGLVSWTTGALANAATITGGADGNTINFAAATKAVTFTGGAGVDTVTGNGQANTINTYAGNDIVALGNGANTVDLGDGNDTITLGTGLNAVTLGAGNDTVNVVAGSTINVYSTITDAAKGDILSFTNLGTETFATAKISLADTATFTDYLNEAAKGAGNVNAAISWFQYGGNTYVVEDVSAGATFVGGTDMVVKLTGLVDLSTATGAGTNAITIA